MDKSSFDPPFLHQGVLHQDVQHRLPNKVRDSSEQWELLESWLLTCSNSKLGLRDQFSWPDWTEDQFSGVQLWLPRLDVDVQADWKSWNPCGWADQSQRKDLWVFLNLICFRDSPGVKGFEKISENIFKIRRYRVSQKKVSLVDCWSYQSFVAFNIVRWAQIFFIYPTWVKNFQAKIQSGTWPKYSLKNTKTQKNPKIWEFALQATKIFMFFFMLPFWGK